MDHPRLLKICLLGALALAVGLGVGVIVADAAVAGAALHASEHPEENQSAPMAAPNLDTSERLMLPSAELGGEAASVSIDPGATTTMGFERAVADYEASLLEARLDDAANDQERVGVLDEDLAELRIALEDIYQDERALHRAYLAGEISASELVAGLAMTHERSLVLQERLEHQRAAIRAIRSPGAQEDATRLSAELARLSLDADTFQGPLRAEAVDALAGVPGADRSMFVQASPGGSILASIEDGVFTREMYFAPNRDRPDVSSFGDTDRGRERGAELYPWTFEESVGTEDRLRGGIYWVSVEHPHGVTTSFLDGTTELPFREIHELDLFALPTETALTVSEGGYDLVVEETYAGGPTRIELSNADAEAVAGADLFVDDRFAAQTDGEGVAWVVAPGEVFELTVVLADMEITAEVAVSRGEPTE